MKTSVYFTNILGVISLFIILIWPFDYFFNSGIGSKILYSVLIFFGATIFGEQGDTEMSATILSSITSSIAIGFFINYFILRKKSKYKNTI